MLSIIHSTDGQTIFLSQSAAPPIITMQLRVNVEGKLTERTAKFVLRDSPDAHLHYYEESLACATKGHAPDCECARLFGN